MEVYEQSQDGKGIPRRGNSTTQGLEARARTADLETAGSTCASRIGAPHSASPDEHFLWAASQQVDEDPAVAGKRAADQGQDECAI